MALTAFTRELGLTQGRLAPPAGWTQPEGDAAFVLGFDLPDHTELLNLGDYVEVSQSGTFTGAVGDTKLIRVRARLRGPSSMPAGTAWRVSLYVDGVECARRTLRAGALRDLLDLAANVGKLGAAAHTIAIRLSLVAA